MNETYGKAGLARNVLRAALAVDGFMLLFALCASVNHNGGGATLLLLFLAGLTGLALWYATKEGVWFVMRLEGRWKAVCSRLGFDGIGPEAFWKHGLKGRLEGRTEIIYPQLRNVQGNWEAWTAEVRFIQGQTIDEYNEHAAKACALAFDVAFVNFDRAESGLIRIRAGDVPVPPAYDFEELTDGS